MSQPPESQPFVWLRRLYAAPRERVFRAWTDPQALESWFRPFGMPITVACLELRAGGLYQFNIHESTGKISVINGHYVEIVRPEKLVYTWISDATDLHETLVTMHFTERADMTELTLIHERFTHADFVQRHEEGWNSMLNALETIFSN